MLQGDLTLSVRDLRDQPLGRPVTVQVFTATGARRRIRRFVIPPAADAAVRLTAIPCAAGAGTVYLIRLTSPNFRRYEFFQRIQAKRNTPSESPIRFVVKPDRVQGIRAPTFARLRARERAMLDDAAMLVVDRARDEMLRGRTGADLYDHLGPLRQACLLNVFVKAAHPSAAGVARFLRRLLVVRQDRVFCEVDPRLPETLQRSDRFKSAPGALHEPLRGFTLQESFKSRDGHANLQVTLMHQASDDIWAADVDIDEASGIEHGFEVLRNSLTRSKTNPYLIREIMILADRSQVPRYDFELP